MGSKKNILYLIFLLLALVYGIAIGHYKIFPFQQIYHLEGYVTDVKGWVMGHDMGPENVEILETSLHRILINEFPVEKDYSPDLHKQGGALTSIDSLIYVSSNRNDRGKENLVLINTKNFQRIEVDGLSVPMNYHELLDSPIMDIEDFPLQKFRVNGLYVEKKDNDEQTLFVSHSEYHPERRCLTYSLSRVDLTFGKSGPEISRDWETIFRASPCLYPEEDEHGYDGEMAGGPILNYDEDRLLVSVGSYHRDGVNHESLPMDSSSTFGKLILLDKKSGEYSLFAIGLRNTQGVFRDADNNIWATDHGPQGGDELNLIKEGQNYGWPQVTYGIFYGNREWPLNEAQGRHSDFEKPVAAWVPSIATSTLVRLDQTTKFPLWRNDILVGSLGDKSLHRVRLNEENHAVYTERIEIGYRIRDLAMLEDHSIALLTDAGLILILDDGGPVYEETGPVVETRIKVLEKYDRLWGNSQIDDYSSEKPLTAETIFVRKCSSCHNMNNVNNVAPHLDNIFTRKVGSVEDFNYSTALASTDTVWSPELFKDFLLQRSSSFSNTTMPNIDLSESEVDSIIHYIRR